MHVRVHWVSSVVFERRFGTGREMPSVKFYHVYNDWVREEVRKRGREVLEWTAEDGYGPLCEFPGTADAAGGDGVSSETE